MVEVLGSAAALLVRTDPVTPALLVRPRILARRAAAVCAAFPGEVLYAVKCNDREEVLHALVAGGLAGFEAAGIGEIRRIRALFGDSVTLAFMNPVKNARAVAEAYRLHGVRRFALDHASELDKIVRATDGARDLELVVRLAVDNGAARLPLSGKFGARPEEAVELLRAARPFARRLGLTFHVGSQCTDPAAFARAIALCAEVAEAAGGVEHLDVGGGFPARYRGDEPEFEAFVAVIRRSAERLLPGVELACEPGRLLVADGVSVLTRVEQRRGRRLYLDDGVYGNLAELRWLGPCFPLARITPEGADRRLEVGYDLFGPTCDSIDAMPGPHWLPADVEEGDLIEVGMAGAYTNVLATRFNGFGEAPLLEVDDEPWYLAPPAGALAPESLVA